MARRGFTDLFNFFSGTHDLRPVIVNVRYIRGWTKKNLFEEKSQREFFALFLCDFFRGGDERPILLLISLFVSPLPFSKINHHTPPFPFLPHPNSWHGFRAGLQLFFFFFSTERFGTHFGTRGKEERKEEEETKTLAKVSEVFCSLEPLPPPPRNAAALVTLAEMHLDASHEGRERKWLPKMLPPKKTPQNNRTRVLTKL